MARDFGKVKHTFWTGETGIRLRKKGANAQLVALYLVTGPNVCATGIYHLQMPSLCHHTGLSTEEATEALRSTQEVGFCMWDQESEMVFVPMMAMHQIGETLAEKDKNRPWIVKRLSAVRKCKFTAEFYNLYAEPYGLTRPSQGPPKGHARFVYGDGDGDGDGDRDGDRDGFPPCGTEEKPLGGAPPTSDSALSGDQQLTTENLAFLWRSHVRVRKPEPQEIVVDGIEEMVAAGIPRQEIRDEVVRGPRTTPKRDRSEWLKQMQDRLLERLGIATSKKGKTNEPIDPYAGAREAFANAQERAAKQAGAG